MTCENPGELNVSQDIIKTINCRVAELRKLMLHEMGHVEGLPHCRKAKTCIMRDAEGKNHFSELNDFCSSCKVHLIDKGCNWIDSIDIA